MNSNPGRIIKRGAVRVAGAAERSPSGGPAGAAAAKPDAACGDSAEPSISLHREGDTIVAIEVTCGCGRTTVLECDYGEE